MMGCNLQPFPKMWGGLEPQLSFLFTAQSRFFLFGHKNMLLYFLKVFSAHAHID